MKKIALVCQLFVLMNLYGETLLVDIEIDGLKRTREETVLQIIKVQPGDPWQEDSLETVEQRLRQSGIFQSEMELLVSTEEEGIALKLVLQDKWTLLAIPFFSVSQGIPKGGLFALDSNFLGRQHLFLISGSYSSIEQSLFGLYKIPIIGNTPFSYLQTFSYGNSLKRISNLQGSENLGEFRDRRIGTSIRGGYEFSDPLSVYFQMGIYHRSISNIDAPLEFPEQEGLSGELALRVDWEDIYLYPLFSRGTDISLSGIWNFGIDSFWEAQGSASYSLVPWPWLQLQLYGEGFFTQGELQDYRFLGKRRASRSLPDEQIPGKLVLNGDLSAEFRLISLSFGSITLPVFYESGWFQGLQGQEQYSGMGVGLRFYIDKVAVPAMGLEYHHSFSGAEPNVTFAIGSSF